MRKIQVTADVGKDVDKEVNSSIVGGLQASTTTLEISQAVPQKIGHSTTGRSSNTSPRHIPKDAPTGNKDTCSTMFTAA
jgi:hypothetical protein